MRRALALSFGIGWGQIGCTDSGSATDTDTDTGRPPGACGDVSSIDVSITGGVRDQDEHPVSSAHVALVERNWEPGTVHGEANTDSSGHFTMEATDLPVVEGCWGTAVQFWLEGDKGAQTGEKPMNSLIIGAYNDGSLDVDLGQFPLILF